MCTGMLGAVTSKTAWIMARDLQDYESNCSRMLLYCGEVSGSPAELDAEKRMDE